MPFRNITAIRLAIALFAIGLVVAVLSCSSPAREPNIVLVIVDTLRTDALGAYGSPDGLSPNIDRLASGGIRFEHVVAQAPWTAPAITSILSSRYPSEHGQGARRIAPGVDPVSLAEILQKRGYRTAAFVEAEWPYFRRGFQTFDNTLDLWRHNTRAEHASLTFGHAANWIAANRGSKFFVMIHTVEVHDYFAGKDYARDFARRRFPGYKGPFLDWSVDRTTADPGGTIIHDLLLANSDDLKFVRALYDAAVRTTDGVIGDLCQKLANDGLRDNTVVAITADHGEGFDAIARRFHHGGRLHNDLLNVPLVIDWPSHATPAVVAPQVRAIDIAPTLLRFTKAATDRHFRGETAVQPEWSLPFLAPREFHAVVAAERPALSEESAWSVLPSGERVSSEEHQIALSIGGTKLIHRSDHDELYDLDADPGEKSNLAKKNAEMTSAMRDQMARMTASLAGHAKPNASEDLRNILRSLGYLR